MRAVRTKWLNWVVVLCPMADLMGGSETDELCDAFRSGSSESYQGVVLNLSEVRRVNSVGFGALVSLVTEAKRMGTRTAFCCITQTLEKQLAAASARFPNAFATEDEAVRYCSGR